MAMDQRKASGTVLNEYFRRLLQEHPVEKEPLIKTLAEQVEELERQAVIDCKELGSIRATLLVNFGATHHNEYGFRIEDSGTTLSLMLEVLEHLVIRARADVPIIAGRVAQVGSAGVAGESANAGQAPG